MNNSHQLLRNYVELFGSLHRNKSTTKGYAPHKPILLLAVLDEIEWGNIRENLVRITPELVARFRAYWRALVPQTHWKERMVYPFRYLIQDRFWELVKDGSRLTASELGHPTSLAQLALLVDGGRFSPDLWALLQDKVAIYALRCHLLTTYFGESPDHIGGMLPPTPIDYEAERLVREAESRFRPST